jgi:hypothetical protein
VGAGRPDWAIFRPWGDSFLWAGFFKLQILLNVLNALFSRSTYALILAKWFELHFGRFFSQTHLVTLGGR